MKLTLSHTIAAGRERLFDALTDPSVLQRCIPGCESLVESGPDAYEATLRIGVAGLKGTYTGKAAITNKQRPNTLTLSFEGKGGPGFVRGSAVINLTSESGGTHVASEADVQVGGLIAAIGSRLIEAASKKMGADFFDRLAIEITERREGTV